MAIPSSMAWILIGLLKGEFYTCAEWRSEIVCENRTITVRPCQIPETYKAEITSCPAVQARNLRAQSIGIILYTFLFNFAISEKTKNLLEKLVKTVQQKYNAL